MSLGDKVLGGLRTLVLIEDRVQRLETLVEIAPPADGAVLRIAPPKPDDPAG